VSLEPSDLKALNAYLKQGVQDVLFVPREKYLALMSKLYDVGFHFLSDLTAVDYLTYKGKRELPADIKAERFEVVVNLLSHALLKRIRVRVQVPEDLAEIDSIFSIFPSCENFEREVYDMFGIIFKGHPDLTRILMPEDWVGHPLRKDYPVSRVPVHFKESPGPL
jgi:NADH-quinone oxidoreductase subunit C